MMLSGGISIGRINAGTWCVTLELDDDEALERVWDRCWVASLAEVAESLALAEDALWAWLRHGLLFAEPPFHSQWRYLEHTQAQANPTR
jgi:hypothetical protein